MNVELTPDQRDFVQKAIESGRFSREEAVQERWRFGKSVIAGAWRSSRRSTKPTPRSPVVEAGKPQESMKALAEEVKQRLRRRIATEQSDKRD